MRNFSSHRPARLVRRESDAYYLNLFNTDVETYRTDYMANRLYLFNELMWILSAAGSLFFLNDSFWLISLRNFSSSFLTGAELPLSFSLSAEGQVQRAYVDPLGRRLPLFPEPLAVRGRCGFFRHPLCLPKGIYPVGGQGQKPVFQGQ